MKTTLIIEGMTCVNCSNKVSTALMALSGVKSANVDHTKGIAKIEHEESVSTEDLIKIVLDSGFTAKVKRGLFR